jgi:hypothetical protein
MSIFAPPDMFAALGTAACGDPDLPNGVHLRLLPCAALGFPLAPFGLYRVPVDYAEPEVWWHDARGNPAEPSSLANGAELVAELMVPPQPELLRDVAVELVVDGQFDGSIELLHRAGNRVLATRSAAPWIVGGPRVERLRVRGRGRVVGLRTWQVNGRLAVEAISGGTPVARWGLPLDGVHPWYAGGLGAAAALARARRGAPRRLQPPDRPDGPFGALSPDHEAGRVNVFLPDLVQQCEAMVGDPAVAPAASRRRENVDPAGGAPRQFIDASACGTLLVHAMDPGLGRCLGLLGTLDDEADGTRPAVYVAAGLFAVNPIAPLSHGSTLDGALGPEDDLLASLQTVAAGHVGAAELLGEVARRPVQVPSAVPGQDVFFQTRLLLAVAGIVPLADTPPAVTPTLANGTWWQTPDGPSQQFRQSFLFPAAPLAPLVALGREEGAAWLTRHRTVPVPGLDEPRERAVAMLMGSLRSPSTMRAAWLPEPDYRPTGMVSDAPIPATAAPATYRVALGDLFGRYGASVDFAVPPPTRPLPPVPAVQAQVILDGPDGMGAGAASPGHVALSITVPPVTALAAGSFEITSVELSFDGVAQEPAAVAPAAGPQVVERIIALPELVLGATARSTLSAAFVDSAGRRSEPATVSLAYGDRRRPATIPTGIGLIWTSRPGPAPEVELALGWPADGTLRYRAYIADERGLRLTGATRAEVATAGGLLDRDHALGGREQFRLLTDPPIEAKDGQAQLTATLPRSQTTVQFVRIVPLTANGREAPFDQCGVVAVAVPSERTPPPPRASVEVDPQSGLATIVVDASGLDLVELEHAEPGLFSDPPQAGARPPQYRIRKCSGPVSEPVYAREIARGELALTGSGADRTFSAQVTDPVALRPFERYSYFVEVCMAPERRLKPGVEDVPPAGGVAPRFAQQAGDAERPFSAPSAPASKVYVPPLPVPQLSGAAASIVEQAGVVRARLTATGAPQASVRVVPGYRLRVWEQWGPDAAITPAPAEMPLAGGAALWEGTDGPAAVRARPLTLRYVVIDPVGRQSAVESVTAA